jgi:alkanesulfonate monooxygenase SsuD/methylene tetrahydromethanopterin reductase-like flavin-dependent oxidoreductase (luciferase family)
VHSALASGGADESVPLEAKIRDLVSLLRQDKPMSSRPGTLQPGPAGLTAPRIWICSMSEHTTKLAAELGLGLVYHNYLARALGKGDGVDLLRTYRAGFRPTEWMREPMTAVVCFGVCAENDRDAARIWAQTPGSRAKAAGGPRHFPVAPTPCFMGGPTKCIKQLRSIARRLGVNEVAVQCMGNDLEGRLRGYELLSEARGHGVSTSPGGRRKTLTARNR